MKILTYILVLFTLSAIAIAIYQFTDNRAGDGSLSLLFGLVFMSGTLYRCKRTKKDIDPR